MPAAGKYLSVPFFTEIEKGSFSKKTAADFISEFLLVSFKYWKIGAVYVEPG